VDETAARTSAAAAASLIRKRFRDDAPDAAFKAPKRAREEPGNAYSQPLEHLALVPYSSSASNSGTELALRPVYTCAAPPGSPSPTNQQYYICDIERPKLLEDWKPELHGPLPPVRSPKEQQIIVWQGQGHFAPELSIPNTLDSDLSPPPFTPLCSNTSRCEILQLDDDEDVLMD
jgi:hypothetical protein